MTKKRKQTAKKKAKAAKPIEIENETVENTPADDDVTADTETNVDETTVDTTASDPEPSDDTGDDAPSVETEVSDTDTDVDATEGAGDDAPNAEAEVSDTDTDTDATEGADTTGDADSEDTAEDNPEWFVKDVELANVFNSRISTYLAQMAPGVMASNSVRSSNQTALWNLISRIMESSHGDFKVLWGALDSLCYIEPAPGEDPVRAKTAFYTDLIARSLVADNGVPSVGEEFVDLMAILLKGAQFEDKGELNTVMDLTSSMVSFPDEWVSRLSNFYS